jgi:hypothetical protein
MMMMKMVVVVVAAVVVVYRPIAKQRLCKQRPLLGNAHNSRAMGLRNLFLSSGSVNNICAAMDTNTTIEE